MFLNNMQAGTKEIFFGILLLVNLDFTSFEVFASCKIHFNYMIRIPNISGHYTYWYPFMVVKQGVNKLRKSMNHYELDNNNNA